MKTKVGDDEYPPEETARRRDAVLKILVNTPPQHRIKGSNMVEKTVEEIRDRAFELAKSGKYQNWQAVQVALETSIDGVPEALESRITQAGLDRECELATGKPAQGTRFRTAAGLRANAAEERAKKERVASNQVREDQNSTAEHQATKAKPSARRGKP